jgi:hypothetical protein
MGIYDAGRFRIQRGLGGRRLRYDLRSLHGMVFCLCAALGVFVVGLGGGGLSGGLQYGAGAFAWLYGMNVLLALGRVPPAIRRAVRSA